MENHVGSNSSSSEVSLARPANTADGSSRKELHMFRRLRRLSPVQCTAVLMRNWLHEDVAPSRFPQISKRVRVETREIASASAAGMIMESNRAHERRGRAR